MRSEAKTAAATRFEAIERSLSTRWLKAKDEATRFEQFRALTSEEKHQLLAYCTALALKPKLRPDDERLTAYDAALSLTGVNVAKLWRPTKENYLGRVTREQLLGIG